MPTLKPCEAREQRVMESLQAHDANYGPLQTPIPQQSAVAGGRVCAAAMIYGVNIYLDTEGRVLNSEHSNHVVRVVDDRPRTGGFLIFERWDTSNGPSANGEFDSWVEDEASVNLFFVESGWQVHWGSVK